MHKSTKKNDGMRSRGGLWILIVAAIVLECTACIQYFFSRNGIREEAVRRAESELSRAELEINVITSQIEVAVRTMAMLAERDLQHPDSMFSITRFMVQNTPNMVGAAIAMRENYYPVAGKWFEAYSCEAVTGDKSLIESRQIGSEYHNYFEMEWYNSGMQYDSCWWCEPYFDNAGARAMLVSCSFPIRDKFGTIVGVALADISLEHLQKLSKYLQVYPDSYYSITSGNGTNLTSPPDTIAGRKYHIFNEFIDATGWSMSIIIPDDVIFGNLRRIGQIVTLLMFLGLIMLGLILYRSSANIKNLIAVNRQNSLIERDLTIAKKIQLAMLPKAFPPFQGCKDLNIHGIIIPAKEVGGDLYDFYIRGRKLLFCIGDVSGKGIPASLVMAVTRSLFRSVSAHEDSPAKIITQMNDSMSETNEQNMFVTLFLGILDMDTGHLEYCNAGHNAPVIIRNGQPTMLPCVPNLPLGILSGFAFTSQTGDIDSGDTMFLYTDGLTEAEDAKKTQFGEERLFTTIETWGQDITAEQQTKIVKDAIDKFVGNAEQSDDLTMLAIRFIKHGQGDDTEQEHMVRHSIVMRNDIQQIPTLAQWIDGLGLPQVLEMTINLALEEAVSNVMLYAYPKDKSGQVLIEAERCEKSIVFIISDNGIPFDPTNQEEPDITLPAEERAIGGLGIHLVRQIMDEIKYERKDNKNILTLIKKL